MKKLLLKLLLLCLCTHSIAQSREIDSMQKLLAIENDTTKIKTLISLGDSYKDVNNEKSLTYYFQAIKTAENTSNKELLFQGLIAVASLYEHIRNHELALEYGLKAQAIAEQQNNKENLYKIYDLIGGFIYFNQGNYSKAFEYGQKMLRIAKAANDNDQILYMYAWMADVYRLGKQFDSSRNIYFQQIEMAKKLGKMDKVAQGLHGVGMAYYGEGDYNNAISYYKQSITEGEKAGISISNFLSNLDDVYFNAKKYDEAIETANAYLSRKAAEQSASEQIKLYHILFQSYLAKNNFKEALTYELIYTHLKDSLEAANDDIKLTAVEEKYKIDKQTEKLDFLQNQVRLQNRLRTVLIIGALLLVVVIVLIANKYQQKRKSELSLSHKNNELTKVLQNLKLTQAQLIQSEKMASLGELTAGIAHEIQNPLNFVTNFSEVNNELIDEMTAETDVEEIRAIANDIRQNNEKINYHGRRADAIVKGMLQHSRQTKGIKEPTDINKLADEYLRLSYHGLRAKDKAFNADFTIDSDESIGKINIVPQDMGRVLLNLFNNAFYAVNEKKKTAGESYKPVVSIQTKKIHSNVEIVVKDNGSGIPKQVADKIFQPFFTTKPTGEGTGLGLSLSYDIVTKEHGGTIKVESEENSYTKFIIVIPS